jgi:MarR family transcriptional regulator for hemolysin
MLAGSPDLNFMFALAELQRLVRLYADQQASQYGVTRAQWAVLAKLERMEGLQQAKLAKLMEVQPITLTRLIDRLCALELVERRADLRDRRANRLYLTPAARPLLAKLKVLRSEINQTALRHMSLAEAQAMVKQLETIKDNVRHALRSECAGKADKSRDRRNG